jgi:riboflavin kinase/FMN adenylyltransferase
LLDFSGEVYGEGVRVDFIEYLRPIHAFGSAEALAKQIEIDVARAREVVARVTARGP